MKTKTEMMSMLMADLTEYRTRAEMLETETNHDLISIQTSILSMIAVRIRLLYDILGEEVPEEYWDELEEI